MTWADVWDEVVPIIRSSRSTAHAADRVSELRGIRTSWADIAKAWRRRKYRGLCEGAALTQLGTDLPPPRCALEQRIEYLEQQLRFVILLANEAHEERIWDDIGEIRSTCEEALGED